MERKDELMAKYNEGLADPAEIKQIEKMIEEGQIELTELRELSSLDDQMLKSEDPMPSLAMNDGFYTMLAAEKAKQKKASVSFKLPELSILLPRLGFATALLIIGFVGGNLLQRPSDKSEVKQLTAEVGELKEMMMLSLLEKESASDRLRAVSLTSEMDQVSDKVTKALFQTLNHDGNVNVRLAALEALAPYINRSEVRKGLVLSISQQDSPLVQVTLADLMVNIQEKKSVKELQKLLDNDSTPRDIKNKIKKSIDVLI